MWFKTVLKKILRILTLITIMLFLSYKVPDWQYIYLHNKVGSKTVRIFNPAKSGGGTGVYINSPSGNTYILTNSHVCEYVAQDDNSVLIEYASKRYIKRHIIELSEVTDLCLVEALNDRSGLNLANSVNLNKVYTVIGYPYLGPQNTTVGEFLSLIKEDEIDEYISNIFVFPGSSGSPAVNDFGDIVGLSRAVDTRTNYGFFVPLKDIKEFLSIY